jgi:hypothetical protein
MSEEKNNESASEPNGQIQRKIVIFDFEAEETDVSERGGPKPASIREVIQRFKAKPHEVGVEQIKTNLKKFPL